MLKEGIVIANRYKILDVLGRGGMGVVYLAYDRELDEEIALKTLPREFAYDTRAINDMRSEVKVARGLSHHNIVRVHDLGKDGDLVFITMEYVKGKNLSEILAIKGPLPLNIVIKLARQVADALDYAHTNNVIHRDIKPSNIMVTQNLMVKVMDFGIARAIKETHSRISKTEVKGTPVYMSPEQYRGREITKATDIYSFSATIYELLSGHPPFYRGNIEYQILNEKPEPIEGIPDEVNRAVLWGLAKEPDERPGTAGELVSAMEGKVGRPIKEGEVKEHEVKGEEEAGKKVKKRGRGGKVVILVGMAIILVVAIWAILYHYTPSRVEEKPEKATELMGYDWEKYAKEYKPGEPPITTKMPENVFRELKDTISKLNKTADGYSSDIKTLKELSTAYNEILSKLNRLEKLLIENQKKLKNGLSDPYSLAGKDVIKSIEKALDDTKGSILDIANEIHKLKPDIDIKLSFTEIVKEEKVGEKKEEEVKKETNIDNKKQILCWYNVSPNPASIPEKYTVRYYIKNMTGKDIFVEYIMDGDARVDINKIAPAGEKTVLYSASGVTYISGVFHHGPIYYYTDAGKIRAPDYDFVVR